MNWVVGSFMKLKNPILFQMYHYFLIFMFIFEICLKKWNPVNETIGR